MSFNLLDILKDQVSGTLAEQASGFLGEDKENVQSALGGIFPTLLGSVIEKGSSETGANGLMGIMKGLDMDMLGNIGNIFGGGSASVNNLLGSGGGIVDALFGNKLGGVADMISNVSGIGKGSSTSLLKMAAPFLLKIIGEKVGGGGVSGLMNLLMGQTDNVASALPKGMGSVLGLSSFGNILGGVKDTVTSAADTTGKIAGSVAGTTAEAGRKVGGVAQEAATSGLGFLKWLLPLLLLAAIAYFVVGKGCASDAADNIGDAATTVLDKSQEVAGDAADMAGEAVATVTAAARAAFDKVDATAKAALDNISFAANSAGQQMMDFIEGKDESDAIFRFNNLTFETGSAKMDAASVAEVDNIVAILKAYPDVNIEIQGHTDNTGNADTNMELSQARAEAVKARLLVGGIEGGRIVAKGYGQNNPVADNGTEEGRTENRRIEIQIKS